MNTQAIEQAIDTDLRFSQKAMQRAALRARELAHQTGTSIVVFRNGVVEHLRPQQDGAVRTAPELSEPAENDQQ